MGKPDSVEMYRMVRLDGHLSECDILRPLLFRFYTGMPHILDLRKASFYPVRRGAGQILGLQQVGLSRFTPTRLCDSQILLIQDLFLTPHVGKESKHQPLLVGAYTPCLAFCCLDFPVRL